MSAQLLIYRSPASDAQIQVLYQDERFWQDEHFWMTQRPVAELFGEGEAASIIDEARP